MRIVRGDVGGRPDQEALAAMGLAMQEDEPPDAIAVWPENEHAVKLFCAMSTQWNAGMAGAIGLRYEALPAVMDLIGIPAAVRTAAFAGLRVMERAALEELRRGRQ